MSVKEYTSKILAELTNNLYYLDDLQLSRITDSIQKAGHIFTAGAGRSGIAIRAFTNRLMHLGYAVSVIGEISTPQAKDGDLLIIGSGSGETESLVALAQKAKKKGLSIALLTMDINSSLAGLSDVTVVLPGVSPKLHGQIPSIPSIQPMGSAFEQISLLTYDGIILELMERTGQTSASMFERHANLE